jgi:hypothetical protein
MTNYAARTSIAIALVASLFAGCSTEVKRTGFIPKSVTMKSGENQSHKWAADTKKLAAFGKVVVWPTETPAGNAYGDLEPEKLATLRGLLEKSIKEAFGASLGNGDRTLVIRSALTAVKPNKPLLNVAPQSQIMKRGYGYAACEIYATDGDTGPVVAAFMQTTDTERFSTEKLDALGTAERACNEWGAEFRELFPTK